MTVTPACDWPVNTECVDLDGVEPGVWADMVTAASGLLWRLTGRKFGACERIIRPCRQMCGGLMSGSGWGAWWNAYGGGGYLNPAIINGSWVNMACGGCVDDCSCTYAQSVLLPPPALSVEAVWLDGVLLDPGKYKVFDLVKLVRTDGDGWPWCQRLDLPLTAHGTFGVAYKRGSNPPAGADTMTAKLARELVRACAGETCRLPGRVTQVSRDGVSMTLDPTVFYTLGLTGIPEVDQWISSVNPHHRTRQPYLRFPGDRRPSSQTYPLELPPTPI